MTNVLAPYSESKSVYNGYEKSAILDTAISFIIPIYNNMPEIPVDNPNIDQNAYKTDNTKVYCNATNVNIRTGPATTYEIITAVSKDYEMIRIKKGVDTGWDKVRLSNGIIGYIYNSYVTETAPEPQKPEKISVTGITIDINEIYMEVGDNLQIACNVKPENASDKKILYESKDDKIASINESGTINANKEGIVTIIAKSNENNNIKQECIVHVINKVEDNKINFDNSLTIDGLQISGIDYTKNTVAYIKQLIKTDYEIEIVNNKNKILEDTDLVGAGTKINVKNNGEIIYQYTIILYGDTNGDGKISSVDLLVLQRHILEIETIGEIYKKAANINKKVNGPSSIDLLLIQRHILGIQIIEQ